MNQNADRICFFGGYRDAQRKQIFLLPEYLADAMDNTDFDAVCEALADDFELSVKVIKITGSGFRSLSHRDYLGSILSLGIERSSLGDICIFDDSTALIFCTDAVKSLILSELTAIGRVMTVPVSSYGWPKKVLARGISPCASVLRMSEDEIFSVPFL